MLQPSHRTAPGYSPLQPIKYALSDALSHQSHGNFIDFLSSKDRSLRKQVFRGVYDSYKKWSNTVSMMYISKLKNDTFYARVRKYDSARAMYLSDGDIPESVYEI